MSSGTVPTIFTEIELVWTNRIYYSNMDAQQENISNPLNIYEINISSKEEEEKKV